MRGASMRADASTHVAVDSVSMEAFRPFIAACALALALPALAQGPTAKPRVEKTADLPRLEYRVQGKVDALLDERAKFSTFAAAVRGDTQSVLDRYEIVDKAIERTLYVALAEIDWLDGRHDAALAALARARALDARAADTLAIDTLVRAVDGARRATGVTSGNAFRVEVAKRLRSELDARPAAAAFPGVRRAKSTLDRTTEAGVLAEAREAFQPAIDAGDPLPYDVALWLVDARFRLVVEMPLKATVSETYAAYLATNRVLKPDVWEARAATLPPGRDYAPVPVAIWDSGVDTARFGDRVARDASGAPALIAFDRRAEPAQGDLASIPASLKAKLPRLKPRLQGMSDLQADVDSTEADELKSYLATLSRDAKLPAVEELQEAGNFIHGTFVAGIAADGNPAIRLVVARIEFSHSLKPDPCPSLAQAQKDAQNVAATFEFFRRHRVRVVNMSFVGSARDTEAMLEACGVGSLPSERRRIAREWFELGKQAMASGIASAPEILFVASAPIDDASVTESVPADLVAPNLITVGAVDRAGDEAPYTGHGRSVAVYANGDRVDGTMPGGERYADSGPWVAAPQVANLAAKILAVNPALTPPQVIALIRETSEKSPDGRRALIHPKKALAAASAKG